METGKGVRSKEEEERVWSWPSKCCEKETEATLVQKQPAPQRGLPTGRKGAFQKVNKVRTGNSNPLPQLLQDTHIPLTDR